MYNGVAILKKLEGRELDNYLALGWYRMEQTVFTTHFLKRGQDFFSAVWLRYILSDFNENSSFKKLSKLNKDFDFEISDFSMDQELIDLYDKYFTSKDPGWPQTLDSILLGGSNSNIFHTKLLRIQHQGKLIAAGYFDIGEKSAAGITSFFDPEYAKFSLGRYLMFLKIRYCISLHIDYFYPGYFVPGVNSFNYKLDMNEAATEFYHVAHLEWRSMKDFKTSELPLHLIQKKLIELKHTLQQLNVITTIVYYGLFNRDIFSPYNCPLFLLIHSSNHLGSELAVQYDLTQQRFMIFDCSFFQPSELLVENQDKIICNQFIHFDNPILKTDDPFKIMDLF
ncbi:MAG: hypothetical protein ACO29O_03065 [Chitinophagaceae bacterium]